MSQRTHLIVSRPGHSQTLFEAVNILPLFWLSGISRKDLDMAAPKLKAVYDSEQEDISAVTIKAPATEAIRNMQDRSLFFQAHFPAAWRMYEDFRLYVSEQLQYGGQLEIDAGALSAFEGIGQLIANISQDLVAMDTNQPASVAGYFEHAINLTGDDYYIGNRFRDRSPAFNTYKGKRIPVKRTPRPSATPAKKSLPTGLVLTIVSLALFYVPYRGLLKDGFSFGVIFVSCLCILFFVYALRYLLSALRRK